MTRTTITYKGLSIRDPAPYGEAGAAWQENFVIIADTLDTLQGSLDTALGGLVIGSDIQAHSANLDTWSSIAPSTDGQSLVAAADYAAMRGLLGVRPGADVQAYSANLGTWSGVAPSANGQSLVAADDYAAMRGLLGLGTMATQEAGSVAITGGSITGITDLAVADGGTGASDAAGARGNLGLGSIATQAANSVAITGGAIDGTAIGATTPGVIKAMTLETAGNCGVRAAPASYGLYVPWLGGDAVATLYAGSDSAANDQTAGYFISKSGYGVHGTSTSNIGLRGSSSSSTGVYGSSSSGTAVQGVSGSSYGIYGSSTSGIGMRGSSIDSTGVYGSSTKGYAATFIRNAETPGSGTTVLYVHQDHPGDTNAAARIRQDGVGPILELRTEGTDRLTVATTGELSIPSDTVGLKLDAAGTTTLYSNGSYLVTNKGFINPGTLVEVAEKNRSLVYGHDGTYAYLVYQPYVWGGSAWTETRGCGFGMLAIEQNTGTDCVGVGYSALRNNTGHVCAGLGAFALSANQGAESSGIGYLALQNNTGARSTGCGSRSLQNNTGASAVAIGCGSGERNIGGDNSLVGDQSGMYNTGKQVAGLGNYSLIYNTGDNTVALGYNAGVYNDGSNNTFLGGYTASTFDANDSAAKTFDHTAVDPVTDRITIPAHGFGTNGQYTNLKFTEGTSPITGLSSGSIYQAKIIDANTIGLNEPDGPNGTTRTIANITAAGTGTSHTFTPQHKYSNATCVGSNSAPSASNQVTLGDTAVTEVKTSGVILPGGYKAADGSAGISETITFKDADSVTHTLVFKDGLLTSHTTS